jgi:hypothetical protein
LATATERELQKRKSLAIEPAAVQSAAAAKSLTYAVAFSDGLLGPNDLGYVPDQSVSLVRKDEIVIEEATRAAAIISKNGKVFGEKTEQIFDGIVAELELKRSMATFNLETEHP